MKHFSLLFALVILFFAAPAEAADVTYQASMTGIDCAACKKTIARSIGKLSGVKTIRIVKGSGQSHTLYVVTDGSKALTKSNAVQALGKNAPHYKIVSWSRKG